MFIGLFKNMDDYKRGLGEFVKEKHGSNFVVMRVNMFDEVVIMNQYDVDDNKSTAEELNAVLRHAVKSAAEDHEEEAKYLKNYEHEIRAQRDEQDEDNEDSMPVEHDDFGAIHEADIESDRMIRVMQ